MTGVPVLSVRPASRRSARGRAMPSTPPAVPAPAAAPTLSVAPAAPAPAVDGAVDPFAATLPPAHPTARSDGQTSARSPDLDLSPPDLFDIPGFKVLGELGRGGMGVVYHA